MKTAYGTNLTHYEKEQRVKIEQLEAENAMLIEQIRTLQSLYRKDRLINLQLMMQLDGLSNRQVAA